MMKYSVSIVWSEEDEGFIAVIPEFKNLSAFGETYEEALKQAEIAADGYIETLKEEKLPLPEPNKLSDYSGQIRLRMPRLLHQVLSEEAVRQDISLNTYMVSLLSMNYGVNKISLPAPRSGYKFIVLCKEITDVSSNFEVGEVLPFQDYVRAQFKTETEMIDQKNISIPALEGGDSK